MNSWISKRELYLVLKRSGVQDTSTRLRMFQVWYMDMDRHKIR